jgi:hypothetical protein
MGRPPDPRAGYTLLDALRSRGDRTPFIIYAGSRAPEHVAESRRHGALGCTNRPQEVIEMVLEAIGKSSRSGGQLAERGAAENNADLGPVVVEIDPETAVARPIRIESEEQFLFFVSYDPVLETLFIGGSSTSAWEALGSIDLATGQLGSATKMLVADSYCIGAFFDKHGHPWLFSATDNDINFKEYPPVEENPPTNPVGPIAGFSGAGT